MRKEATARGLQYYESCFNEPGVFEEYGGDILFLARNLLAASPPEAQLRTRGLVDALAQRFMACNSHLAEDEGQTEMAAILTTIEGLYALKRMGYHTQATRTTQKRACATGNPTKNKVFCIIMLKTLLKIRFFDHIKNHIKNNK